MKIYDLRTNGLRTPLGLDRPPTFGWKVESARRGVLLTRAQVQVLDGEDVLWDSGSRPTPGVPRLDYDGPALAAMTPYRWRVRVWDERDETSDWSAEASFETGLLGGSLDPARWIRLDGESPVGTTAPVQYLRAEFRIDGAVRRARSYSTALGWYRLHVNGADATGPGFYPGFTAFESRVEYQVRDVTDLLVPGDNAIGIVLADGRFRGRIGAQASPSVYGNRTAAIARIEIELEDGRRHVVVTDESWQGGHGAIVRSDPRDGEEIDARLRGEWSVVGGSLPERLPVIAVEESRSLQGVSAPPMLAGEPLAALETRRAPSGALIVDFGQNLHGLTRLTLRGPAGSRVTVRHSEVLTPEGELDLDYVAAGLPFDLHLGPNTLVLSGGTDVFEPTFCTQGFRYAAIEADDGVEVVEALSVPVHAALDYHGRFESSAPLVNRFHENVVWSMRGNFLDVPTDCPTRERSGWTGDAQVFARTALLLADAGPYLGNWLADARLQQHSDGAITDVVPLDAESWREGGARAELAPGMQMPPSGSAGWGDAIVLIPWDIYQATGSTVELEQNYDAMVKWVERYARMAAEHRGADRTGEPEPHERYLVDTGYHWGEWLEPPGEGDGVFPLTELVGELMRTPRTWVATAYFEHSSRLLSTIAGMLGRAEDAERFAGYAEGARDAWQREYARDPQSLEPDAQATYVRALQFDLVPDERRERTAARLVERIRARGDHLGTGFLSTGFLLEQLTEAGYGEVALDLLLQEESPSWLGQVLRGATTVWETWTGYDDEGRATASHNHYSLGASARWLYEYLGGIRPAAPGWRTIDVAPLMTDRIPRVAVATGTPFGEVAVEWELSGDRATLDLTVPVGAEARVRLPGAAAGAATLDGAPLRGAEVDGDALLVTVGSGSSRFAWSR